MADVMVEVDSVLGSVVSSVVSSVDMVSDSEGAGLDPAIAGDRRHSSRGMWILRSTPIYCHVLV